MHESKSFNYLVEGLRAGMTIDEAHTILFNGLERAYHYIKRKLDGACIVHPTLKDGEKLILYKDVEMAVRPEIDLMDIMVHVRVEYTRSSGEMANAAGLELVA